MEWVFNTARKLPAVKQRRKIPAKNSQEFIENKKKFQHLFKIQLKIRVSFVRKEVVHPTLAMLHENSLIIHL